MKVVKGGPENATVLLSDSFDVLSDGTLKDEVFKLIEEGCKYLTFDFTNITILTSSGLGRLIIFQKTAKENGGKIKIINVKSGQIRKLPDAINLKSIIHYD